MKIKRNRFTETQRAGLEQAYLEHKYAIDVKDKLANELKLTPVQVLDWFRSKRKKEAGTYHGSE